MNNSKLLLIEITPEQFQQEIVNGVRRELEVFKKNFQQSEAEYYYTRKEVAELFKVDLSTVHNWCKSGRLKRYGIGNRVYFLKSDIKACLKPLKG